MLRKTVFALATIGAIGAAALIPTEASAGGGGKGFHHHNGWGWGWGFGAAALITSAAIASNCYRWVETRSGDLVRVNVCE
jgi:hypothetical protein